MSAFSFHFLDLGYAIGTFIMLLQCTYLGYINDIYNNTVLCNFSFFLILLLLSTCRKKRESLKLTKSDEICIVKGFCKSELVHDYTLVVLATTPTR